MPMPELRWHFLGLPCLHCDLQLTITGVAISADGETLFQLVCVKCGKEFNWISNWANMIAQALFRDIQEANRRAKTVRPMPSLPSPDTKKSDEEFLHEMGIGGSQ